MSCYISDLDHMKFQWLRCPEEVEKFVFKIFLYTGPIQPHREEMEKQDCEKKACARLMEKLKKQFPRLCICLCADSLHACEPFFRKCEEYGWQYLLRFKEGSIPTIGNEYRKLKELEKNRKETKVKNGRYWNDYKSLMARIIF
ncbi:MAG: hypothetical protein Q4C91_17595 [Eubacteriales bacterium]|nr:hypothetical protein [Eubacteriales bacterium]